MATRSAFTAPLHALTFRNRFHPTLATRCSRTYRSYCSRTVSSQPLSVSALQSQKEKDTTNLQQTLPRDKQNFSTERTATTSQSPSLTSTAERATTGPNEKPSISPSSTLKLLYDGACPLCMREVNFLQSRHKKHNNPSKTLTFVDIAADNYSPAQNANISFEKAMGRIHAIEQYKDPNKDEVMREEVIEGVEVFRKAYEYVGLGWVYGFTRIWGLKQVVDVVYGVWADWRLQLTGRPSLDKVLEQREEKLGGRCRLEK